MVWQDVTIAIANLLFTFSLFSQCLHGFKQKKGYIILKTALLTAIGLYIVAISFFTLKLYFSGIIASINASLWLTMFIQRIIYPKA